MRLLFCKPTYGPTADPCFDRNHRNAIMYAANHGVTWVGDVSPDRMGWVAARNKAVKEILEVADADDVDGVFWVDDDVMIPVEAPVKLSGYGLDMVSGLYFQRQPPFWPLFAHLDKKGHFEWPAEYPQNVLAPCDGVGFGCLYTSVKVLRAVSNLEECLGPDLNSGPFGGDFGKRTYGEDFLFCLRAGKLSFQPYVDTSMKCQHHIGPEFSDEELFRKVGGLTVVGGNGA